MPRSVFSHTLWSRKRSIFFWILGVFIYALLIISLYPSFGELSAYQDLIENLPPAFEAIMGEIGEMGTPAGYLTNEHFNHMYPILMTMLTVGVAMSIIHNEEYSGTLELIISRPISRSAFLIHKIVALYTVSIIIALTNWVGLAAGPYFVDVTFNEANALWASLAGMLIAILFGMFSLAITALTNKKGVAVGLTIVTFIVSYLLDTFGQIIEWMKDWQEYSIFHYYNVQQTLTDGPDFHYMGILILVGLAFIPISIILFNRRDIGA